MMTIVSDFQFTQVEERHKIWKSNVKEYVLGLADVRKILEKVDLHELTSENLMEDKAQII